MIANAPIFGICQQVQTMKRKDDMKLSERIKDHITNIKPAPYGAEEAQEIMYDHGKEILTAVEAVEEGRVLPRLPDGWVYKHIHRSPCGLGQVDLTYWRESDFDCFCVTSEGPTPALAAQAAIDKLNKDGV